MKISPHFLKKVTPPPPSFEFLVGGSTLPPPPAERGLHSMYIIYYISMQIAYYHYFHIIIISRTNWWNCLIFCSWYKFMKKSWLKNFWVGMKKWLWLLCSRYPRLSPEWIDGINDFFACWHKFRKIESYVNDFLVSIVKKWAWLLIHETLKYAISQE